MKQPTKAMLIAKCEALSAANVALSNEVKQYQRRVAALEQAAINQVRDMSTIYSMRALMERCRKLNMQGVPCLVRQGHIVHAQTGAIITATGD